MSNVNFLNFNFEAILIVLLAVISAVAGISIVKGLSGRSKKQKNVVAPLNREKGEGSSTSLNLRAVPFRGWGGSKLVQIPVPTDVPLIVKSGDLKISKIPGAEVYVDGKNVGEVARVDPGCHVIEAVKGDERETIILKGSEYEEEVVKEFMVNTQKAWSSELTPREIISKVEDEISDRENAKAVLRDYERVKYGKIQLTDKDFWNSLRGFGKAFRDPKVEWCGS